MFFYRNIKLIFIIVFLIAGVTEAQVDSLLFLHNPNYVQQMGLYKVYKLKQANIVMLGNSITHGANWNELLGRLDVVEKGVTNDILRGFLTRIQYVYKLHPKVCFIMGGINDIYNWRPVDLILRDYQKVIEELQKRNIVPVIQSTLFAGRKWPSSADRNKEVKKLNKLLQNFARKNDLIFIDLNKRMSLFGFLKSNLTYDGIHLNGNGFKIWGEEVEKVLKKLRI